MTWVLGVLFIVVGVAGIIGELWIYDKGIWWHGPRVDRRNWKPPR
jgi:hypothetical protein